MNCEVSSSPVSSRRNYITFHYGSRYESQLQKELYKLAMLVQGPVQETKIWNFDETQTYELNMKYHSQQCSICTLRCDNNFLLIRRPHNRLYERYRLLIS